MDIDDAIEKLKAEGREVQDAYVSHKGKMMLVVDAVALDYPHVIALALGYPMEDVVRDQTGT